MDFWHCQTHISPFSPWICFVWGCQLTILGFDYFILYIQPWSWLLGIYSCEAGGRLINSLLLTLSLDKSWGIVTTSKNIYLFIEVVALLHIGETVHDKYLYFEKVWGFNKPFLRSTPSSWYSILGMRLDPNAMGQMVLSF